MKSPGPSVVAVTGATGFLGQHLVREIAERGLVPRILSRRDPVSPFWRGIEPQVVLGDLARPEALARLCDGADVVIHLAGLIKAADRAAFDKVNVDGARAVAQAATAAGARFVLVSSLAAREPQLSDYAASKRAGEDAVRAIAPETLIIRPPAIYGPGDRETVGLFAAAQASRVLPVLSPASRVAMIEVRDAAAQILDLVESGRSGLASICDARPDGYGWTEIMTAAAAAVGAPPPRLLRVPEGLIRAAGGVADLASKLSGQPSVFGPGKARELSHADWAFSDDPSLASSPSRHDVARGFGDTVGWYRSVGWLSKKYSD
ncbi:NAD-dependent epimerase/dehydratase family protein [Caulobacter endophyticus]|uniref:NAD-dependent epimerase/dehydratase family protein n=1 Tax=Caulobacter endophyticus TaxID=2172652 RepID=UPI00241082F9|nr:NAD-dependent epimerase/dehydratase family protein [Caulobacter endophyticus]MDG2530092.1 NAD-dependent epimerase/dehydratase family protein [Caulobacter endophyticus]